MFMLHLNTVCVCNVYENCNIVLYLCPAYQPQ
uniref:Uncharacterized protein n=1 Tax=Anguilla anguilla TaxID=7936 RepID=A0A0E9WEN9_ANGAN